MPQVPHVVTSLQQLPAPGDWHVNPAKSELRFETRMVMRVRGSFPDIAGELHVDAGGNASAWVTAGVASLKTGIGMRDRHLRSKEFFDAGRFETVRFDFGDAVARDGQAVTLRGALLVRGQVQKIELPASVTTAGDGGLRVDASFAVNHRAVGFEFRWLPKTVRVTATLLLEAAS